MSPVSSGFQQLQKIAELEQNARAEALLREWPCQHIVERHAPNAGYAPGYPFVSLPTKSPCNSSDGK